MRFNLKSITTTIDLSLFYIPILFILINLFISFTDNITRVMICGT